MELAGAGLCFHLMLRQMKVLVCEDNPIIAMSLVDFLGDIGHVCIGSADRSDRALDIANTETPDLALVDLNLADGWTGPSLVKHFQDNGILCVVISGQTESFKEEAMAVRVFDKPVDERALAKYIESLAAEDG